MIVTRDILWKGIIEDLADDFLRFFFPQYVDSIDFLKPFEFLDKELNQLFSETDVSLRHADKLFRVWLKNGEEHWCLVHVEVQGYRDPNFALRMFQTAYRIKDRFARPLTAIAIYTDDNRSQHVSEYREAFMGTEIMYRFNAYILINQSTEELLGIDNIFATILGAARANLVTKLDDERKIEINLALMRRLMATNYSKEKVRRALNFIHYFVRFGEKENFLNFERQIDRLTQNQVPMGIEEAIIEEIKRMVREEGRGEGREEGREEGIKLGYQKAFEEKLHTAKKMLQAGLSISQISNFLDLPESTIQTLASDN